MRALPVCPSGRAFPFRNAQCYDTGTKSLFSPSGGLASVVVKWHRPHAARPACTLQQKTVSRGGRRAAEKRRGFSAAPRRALRKVGRCRSRSDGGERGDGGGVLVDRVVEVGGDAHVA